MLITNSLRLLLVGAIFHFGANALPIGQISGAQLLAAQLGEHEFSLKKPSIELKSGGAIDFSCDVLVKAEAEKKKELRLFLQAVRDHLDVTFQDHPETVKCVSATQQLTSRQLIDITVSVQNSAGTTIQRTCKVERLRTKAGGRTSITETSSEIDETGKSAITDDEADARKEKNRYRFDECLEATGAAETTTDLEIIVPDDAPKYSLGYVPMSAEDKAMLRVHTATDLELSAVPDSWDERSTRSCKGQEIVDQGSCGACWAFAAGRVYNDRICRKSNGQSDVALAEQDILSCWKSGSFYTSPAADGTTQITKPAGTWALQDGCQGGDSSTAWVTMATEGRVSRWADPYTAKGNPTDACGSVAPALKYKVASDAKGVRVFTIPAGNIALAKQALVSGGSLAAGFQVYGDIMQYRGGTVYTKGSSDLRGGHAVAVIGYGTQSGTPYWLFANSWGKGWGEAGYGKIAISTNGCGFDDDLTFPDPQLNTVCAAKAPCKNGGEFDASCNCKCNALALWGGADCGTCSASCVNGGTLNPSTCSCTCPAGFFGNQCQAYVLVKWKGLSGSTGTITASWSLDHTYTGSYFNRRAAPAGQSGETTSISGGDVTTTGQVGTKDFTVNLLSYIPGYPAGWHYVFMNSQGQNEFGASRGFSEQPLKSLLYDSTRKCLSGGYRPDAGATGLCSDATWPTPSPPAVTPPTPATAFPTKAPVAPPPVGTPTKVPVAPPVTPTVPVTATPTRAPVTAAPVAPPVVPVPPTDQKNSCKYANDGECDEPTYCLVGTDTNDCSKVPAPVAPVPASPPSGACADSTTTTITLNGARASCSQLVQYCTGTFGSTVRSACPKSCGVCS